MIGHSVDVIGKKAKSLNHRAKSKGPDEQRAEG